MKNPLADWSPGCRRALVYAMALIMLALPAVRLLQTELGAIERTRQEAAGLPAVSAVLDLLRVTQQHRGLSNGWLAGADALASRRMQARDDLRGALARAAQALVGLGAPDAERRLTGVEEQIRPLIAAVDARLVSPDESFRRHTAITVAELDLISAVAEASGIAFHSDPQGHQLQGAVLQFLPRATEHLGRLRGQGTRLLALGHAGTEDRMLLALESSEVTDQLRAAVENLRNSGLAAAGSPLAKAMDTAVGSTAEALARADSDLIRAGVLSAPANEYFAALTGAVDKQFRLVDAAFDVLRERLDNASAAARQRFALELAGLLLLAGLGAWLLTLAGRAQRAQEASDARSHAILEAAPDALFVLTPDGSVVDANPAARRLFGREMLGVGLGELLPEAQRATLCAELRALAAGGPEAAKGVARQLIMRRGDGTNVDAEFTAFAASSGERRETIVVIRDISERRRLERQLGQSQKMEAVGQLTGGIAHDFNNLLGVIVGNLDLLERSVSTQEAALKRVLTARKAALRGADLTRRLLAFSRRQHLEPEPLHLADTVSNVIEMAERTLGPEVRLTSRVDPHTPTVMVDAAGLENAVLNLLVNARDAMPNGGSIGIDVGDTVIDERHVAVQAGDLVPGRYASLRITDTGQGMPPEVLDKVFEPFYTTKEPGKGTGLGLAMVYGFVKQSGGHIKIYSEVGVGTTIAITLPVAAAGEAPAVHARAGADDHHARPGATALVVDDEPDLLEVAATYLQEMGYRVLTAPDGPAALRTLSREPTVDLLVTDVVMPGGMNGVKLSQQVRKRRPEVRVVFTSGFPSQALSERRRTRVEGPLVNKPYQRREFVSVLNQVMEGETA